MPPTHKFQNLNDKTLKFQWQSLKLDHFLTSTFLINPNAEGVWNLDGDFITFTLKSYFYQTLLFKIVVLLLLTAILAAAVYIYKKRLSIEKAHEEEEGEENKGDDITYGGSKLNPFFAEECIKKLTNLLVVEKIYRDETISLNSLAKKLKISSHQLSWLVNEKLKRNFHDYINYHRIEEVKIILESPTKADETITDMAHEVGFNSMTAFYKAFKKYTGMNPNQYKKEKGKKKHAAMK